MQNSFLMRLFSMDDRSQYARKPVDPFWGRDSLLHGSRNITQEEMLFDSVKPNPEEGVKRKTIGRTERFSLTAPTANISKGIWRRSTAPGYAFRSSMVQGVCAYVGRLPTSSTVISYG